MKQFYFNFITDRNNTTREVKITSSGMMDALRKAQAIKKELELTETGSITVKFLGVSYSNIA